MLTTVRHLSATAMTIIACGASAWGQATPISPASPRIATYSQNFDSLAGSLLPSVNEVIGTALQTTASSTPNTSPIPAVWSNSATGWTKNNLLNSYDGSPTITVGVPGQGLADYGVDEWEGWNFARVDFWAFVDDQNRSRFGDATLASGTAAIADPDEYFDLGSQDDAVNGGYYSTGLTSPSFVVQGGLQYGLGFDSSWRDESFDDSALGGTIVNTNNQAAEVLVTFDTGQTIQVTKWNSNPASPNFKNDNEDENFASDGSELTFAAPAGATSAKVTFNMGNAANDWWWAIDNVKVEEETGTTRFFDNFETSVTLGGSVNERVGPGARVTVPDGAPTNILGNSFPTTPRPASYTHDASSIGWTRQNDAVAGVGDPNNGVQEWEGWSFINPSFFTFAGGSGREQFTKATGVFAVADPDQWEDLGNPEDTALFDASVLTPSVNIAGIPAGELGIFFDSSWRPSGDQKAFLTVSYDNGPAVELLHWESSSSSPFFKARATNESIGLLLDNPAGANIAKFAFRVSDGGDDYWWGIDNVVVGQVVPEPASVVLLGLALVGGWRLRRRMA
jgi:hypothetical protein